MALNPNLPDVKQKGDTLLSADWNLLIKEIERLEADKLNNFGNPSDGSLTVKAALKVVGFEGSSGDLSIENQLTFGTRAHSQKIDLWKTSYGIGTQGDTQYFRTGKNFAWYRGGTHNSTALNAGGGVTQMVIRDDKVGIGTGSPQGKLDVQGGHLNVGGSLAIETRNYWHSARSDNDSHYGFFEVRRKEGYKRGCYFGYGSPGKYVDLRLEEGNDLAITGGNVGIGTATPKQNLEVAGNAVVHDAFLGNVGHSAYWTGIAHQNMATTDAYSLLLHKDGAYTLINKKDTGSGHIGFRIGNSDKMVINNSGNIGIGTASPSSKLEVAGKIQATNLQTTSVVNSAGGFQVDSKQVIDADGGWHRSYGKTGWFNDTYRGGWYMIDATWIRSYNNKSIYQNTGILRTDGTLQVGPSGNRFIVNTSGRVGIGTTNPGGYKLTISGTGGKNVLHIASDFGLRGDDRLNLIRFGNDGDYQILHKASGGLLGRNTLAMHIHTDDAFGVYSSGWKSLFEVQGGTGSIRIAGKAYMPGGGGWSKPSDIRLKKNVQPLSNTLNKILKLRGVSFEWKNPEKHGNFNGRQVGMIAQEVESFFPEWVGEDPQGYKDLTFIGFEALTIEAMRELKQENEELKKKYSQLADRTGRIEKGLNLIESV